MKKFNKKRFGSILKDLRLNHRLQQDDIADYLEVKRASYSGLERGNYGPGHDVLIGLVTFWRERGEKLTTDFLYGLNDTSRNEADHKEIERLRNAVNVLNNEIESLKHKIDEKDALISSLVKKIT